MWLFDSQISCSEWQPMPKRVVQMWAQMAQTRDSLLHGSTVSKPSLDTGSNKFLWLTFVAQVFWSEHRRFIPAMAESSVILSPVCSAILSRKMVPSPDLCKATYEKIYSVVEEKCPWIGLLHFDVTAGIFASLKKKDSLLPKTRDIFKFARW
jgi:hypothetical protein